MAVKKGSSIQKSNSSDLLKNPHTKLIGAITGIATIFGIGFGIGLFKEGLDSNIEKLRIEQDCAEKLQDHINLCRDERLTEYSKAIEDIKIVVSELKKKSDEK